MIGIFILYPLIGVRNKRVNDMHYALIVNCEKYKKTRAVISFKSDVFSNVA